jgi:hypothetical protein
MNKELDEWTADVLLSGKVKDICDCCGGFGEYMGTHVMIKCCYCDGVGIGGERAKRVLCNIQGTPIIKNWSPTSNPIHCETIILAMEELGLMYYRIWISEEGVPYMKHTFLGENGIIGEQNVILDGGYGFDCESVMQAAKNVWEKD